MKKLIMAYIKVSLLMVSMPMVCMDNSPEAARKKEDAIHQRILQQARTEDLNAKWGSGTPARFVEFQEGGRKSLVWADSQKLA